MPHDQAWESSPWESRSLTSINKFWYSPMSLLNTKVIAYNSCRGFGWRFGTRFSTKLQSSKFGISGNRWARNKAFERPSLEMVRTVHDFGRHHLEAYGIGGVLPKDFATWNTQFNRFERPKTSQSTVSRPTNCT